MDRIKKALTAVLVLALAAIFFALGYWQLDRAREMTANEKKVTVQDEKVYQLSELTQPDEIIPVESRISAIRLNGSAYSPSRPIQSRGSPFLVCGR